MKSQSSNTKNIEDLFKSYALSKKECGSELIRFEGVNEKDVYNCSVPFIYEKNKYIWGRVESRSEWATSITLLFKQREDGVFERSYLVEALPIEDPFFEKIHGVYVLGGVHAVKVQGKIKTYRTYFYKGATPFSLKYFTTGPDYMKDIRLVQLPENKIGVFSRPRNDEIKNKYGSESQIGFTIINSLDELTPSVIEEASYIDGIFSQNEWGGVNQAFYIGGSLIGIIGHQCYNHYENDLEYPTYINMSYVYDFDKNVILDKKIIGTRSDYPMTESKLKTLSRCSFTSGLYALGSGKYELYSGLSDVAQGKLIIDSPFKDFGEIKFIY